MMIVIVLFFFFKQKTAYEMRISDWSSDVFSSDLGVELRGCERTRALLPQALVATEEDWLTEYLAPILAIRVVDSLDQAIDHIARYSSENTESIVDRKRTRLNSSH